MRSINRKVEVAASWITVVSSLGVFLSGTLEQRIFEFFNLGMLERVVIFSIIVCSVMYTLGRVIREHLVEINNQAFSLVVLFSTLCSYVVIKSSSMLIVSQVDDFVDLAVFFFTLFMSGLILYVSIKLSTHPEWSALVENKRVINPVILLFIGIYLILSSIHGWEILN